MSLGSEDLSIFFDDFADECILPGGTIINVIFDTADQEALGGRMIAGDYVMLGKSSELRTLKKTETVQIRGKQYVVQKVVLVDDGEVCEVYLGEKTT